MKVMLREMEDRMRRPNRNIIRVPGGSSRRRELRKCRRDNISRDNGCKYSTTAKPVHSQTREVLYTTSRINKKKSTLQ